LPGAHRAAAQAHIMAAKVATNAKERAEHEALAKKHEYHAFRSPETKVAQVRQKLIPTDQNHGNLSGPVMGVPGTVKEAVYAEFLEAFKAMSPPKKPKAPKDRPAPEADYAGPLPQGRGHKGYEQEATELPAGRTPGSHKLMIKNLHSTLKDLQGKATKSGSKSDRMRVHAVKRELAGLHNRTESAKTKSSYYRNLRRYGEGVDLKTTVSNLPPHKRDPLRRALGWDPSQLAVRVCERRLRQRTPVTFLQA
jgi:hypothetical protein